MPFSLVYLILVISGLYLANEKNKENKRKEELRYDRYKRRK